MPTRLRDLNDTDFDPLNQSKNKNVMRYNHSTGKFDVIPADDVLLTATELPQDFIDVVESEIDVNNITFTGIDGGSF
jgi:hypothetical protein